MRVSFKQLKIIQIVSVVLFLVLMGWVAYSYADGPVVDPGQTPNWVITCEYPVEREDNTPLALNEIAKVNFFVSPDSNTWTPAGSNTGACKQVYDLSQVPDGQYYYTATTVDTDGRGSVRSPEVVALEVKRIQAPRPPTGLSGSAS